MTHPNKPQGIRVYRDDAGQIESQNFCPLALRTQTLADTFPTLRGLAGIEPWDPCLLATETIHGLNTSTRQSLLFILSVWNPEAPEFYGLEAFCIHDALKFWDRDHRTAFVNWANDPWWP